MEVDSLKGSLADWVRGRMRGDDAMAMIAGSGNVNKMNRDMKDLSSTRTTNKAEREEQIASARVPAIKRMAFMIEDALSAIMGVTHGRHPQPPKKPVAGPADETAKDSPDATAEQPASGKSAVATAPPAQTASDTSVEPARGKYGEIKPDGSPDRTSPWMAWSKKALEATTGIRIGGSSEPAKSKWDQMSREEKAQALAELSGSDPEKLSKYKEADLNRILKANAESTSPHFTREKRVAQELLKNEQRRPNKYSVRQNRPSRRSARRSASSQARPRLRLPGAIGSRARSVSLRRRCSGHRFPSLKHRDCNSISRPD